jgi:four helix bundle protein
MSNFENEDFKFNFEELKVYQKAIEFIDLVYLITRKFPKEEEYRITSQFIRAAHSIALNIADGSGGSKPEFKNFLRISKRSTRECVVCATIALRQNFISKETEFDCRKRLVEISKMLNGLIVSIK